MKTVPGISDLAGQSVIAEIGVDMSRAVAASMLTAIYYILRDDVDYHDLGPTYLDTIDRTQVTRRLVRRLENMGHHVELQAAA